MELIWKKEIVSNKTLCRSLGVATFIVLTSMGAFVRIPLPFTPVPLTLQTFFVILSGAVLGSSSGALSQIGYLFLGLSGFSVFTGSGSGLSYLAGPTGGYIVGFILSAYFTGQAVRWSKNNLFFLIASFFLADLIILCCGMFWLRCLFGYSFAKILGIGFLPFVPGDLYKVAVASLLYRKIRPRVQEIF
jgi:biotin transport system substrate-specific component